MNHHIASPADDTTLLTWLLLAMRPASRNSIKEWLRHGRIHVNGAAVSRHDHPVGPADRITLASPSTVRNPVPQLVILHEDEHIIAVEKPCGLLSVATNAEKDDTAFTRLAAILKSRNAGRPYVVHRLDRDTSGVLLFARSPDMRDRLQRDWDAVGKTYFAVADGTPREAAGTIENHLIEGKNLRVRIGRPGGDAKLAITHYRVLGTRGPHAALEVKLGTGRKHQIRVHLASLGCPVIGDEVYGARTNPARRLGLHAWKLSFEHPASGNRVELESPISQELSRFMR
ncbi:MAG: RluA family pseudouridine synthase [Gemmataceae bacterium]